MTEPKIRFLKEDGNFFPKWETTFIGDIVERQEHPVKVDKEVEYREIGIRSHGKGIFHKDPVTGKELGNKRVFDIVPDCLVLNIVFAWERAVAKTTTDEVGMIASHRFPMYKPKDGILDLDYIVRYLISDKGKKILELASPGGAGRNRTLGQKAFMESELPLPCYEEQKKIAEFFDKIDDVISNVEKELEAYIRLKAGMLQKMFPRNGSRVPEVRFPGFTEDWEQRKLGELGSFKNGMNFSKDAMDKGYPFVNLQNIFGRNIIDTDNLGLAEASDNQLKEYNLQKGDVLFVRSSVKLEGVGEAAIVPKNLEKTTYSGFVIRFRDEADMDINFKRFIFGTKPIRDQIMAKATNSANKNISQDVLNNLKLYLPIKAEQQKIGEYFSNLDNLITLHQHEHEVWLSIKKGYIKKMFI